MSIAIMSAMAEENESLLVHMQNIHTVEIGQRVYHQGQLWGHEVVVVFSHWGKVAAASTATVLIQHFNVSEIVFTGVAGAIDRSLNVGDIVVATNLYQHDMDARPMVKRHEIPLLGVIAMPADRHRSGQLAKASEHFVAEQLVHALTDESISDFRLHNPKVVQAAIASGDQFISSEVRVEDIRTRLPDVACVEMEGGAVAQVCLESRVPCSVVRTISDAANEQAGIDFPRFIVDVAQAYSLGIIRNLLQDFTVKKGG